MSLQAFPFFIFFLPRSAQDYRAKCVQLTIFFVLAIPFVGFIFMIANPRAYFDLFSFFAAELATLIALVRTKWRGNFGMFELTLLVAATLVVIQLELYRTIIYARGSEWMQLVSGILPVLFSTAIMARFFLRGFKLMHGQQD